MNSLGSNHLKTDNRCTKDPLTQNQATLRPEIDQRKRTSEQAAPNETSNKRNLKQIISFYQGAGDIQKKQTSKVTDIVNNKTYLDYLEQYNNLSKQELESFKESFIRIFDIDINNPPKILNKQKVDYLILRDCLCIMKKYDNVGKSLEEHFGYAKGTMSSLLRGIKYKKAWELYEKLSAEEKGQIANSKYVEWDIEKVFLERQLKQGGCSQSYLLSKEDYYYAFYLQDQGKTYSEVATILGVKPATVKDWFNGRSRKKEKKEYLLLSTEQLEVLKSRNKAGTLNDIPTIA